MNQISARAAAAREQAREQDGTFGVQAHDRASGIDLDGGLPGDLDPEVAEQLEEDLARRTLVVPTDRAEKAERLIAAANRRLARAGVDEQFTFERTDKVERRTPTAQEIAAGTFMPGQLIEERTSEFVLERPRIGAEGWHFEASVSRIAGSDEVMVRSTPGVDLGGQRPDPDVCDHCGTKRKRSNTYLVRHEESGEQMQLGSTCVSPFLGVKPEGLWALQFDLEGRKPGDGFDMSAASVPVWETRELIAQALAASDGGRGFVSRSRAEIEGRNATADEVSVLFEQRARTESLEAEQREARRRAAQFLEDGTADEVLASAADVDEGSDYGANLHAALRAGAVDERSRATVMSLVGVHVRRKEREAREQAKRDRQASAVRGFVAPVGERVKAVPVTVTSVAYSEGMYGPTTRVNMRDAEGHEVIWWASKRVDVNAGDEVAMTATVKGHGQYNGVDQTSVSRAKLEPARSGAGVGAGSALS